MDQLMSSQPLEDASTNSHRALAGHMLARSSPSARAKVPEPAFGSSLLLSREELQTLTGMRQPKRMCEWLEQRMWVFEAPCRRGELPKVDRAYYLARMSGQQTAKTKRSSPQLDFMLKQP